MGSGDERAIWKQLGPPRVREKLGRGSFDPLYQYFSEQGSHSTFTALQARVRKRPATANQAPGIAMLIGGVRDKRRQLSILMYAAVLTNLALHRAVVACGDRLNGQERGELILASYADCLGMIETLFSLAEEGEVDLRPLELIRGEWKATRDAILSSLREDA